MKYIIKIILVSISMNSLGQAYIPPSADAMGLAKFANIPVSYYTGSTAISIPLTQIGGKELNVPVSLNYNATGIKVGDIAGSVGLGWSLNAGGLITRVVRGLPDDLANGYCTSNFSDQEPDLFYYSILGQSGKFVLDKYGNVVTIPYRPIVIKPGICVYGSTGTWEIIDESGVSYKFGMTAMARESTTIVEKGGTSRTYVSSWLLSEINSPNLTEKIQFTYTSGQYTTKNYFFVRIQDTCHNDVVEDQTSTITIQAKYISLISAPTGNISFSYSSNRKDISGALYLTEMFVSNKSFQQISKFRFQYGYFQSDGCNLEECYRLKLDKIFDLAPDPVYNFIYNTYVNLPSRYSKNFDYWGYYNSNTVDSWIPYVTKDFATLYRKDPNITWGGSLSGADRNPEESKSMSNILIGITDRSGGIKQFVYESHNAGNTGVNQNVGGVRIKTITAGDGLGNVYTRSFTYFSEANGNLSSGYFYRTPKYMIAFVGLTGQLDVYKVFSHSHNEIFDLNGAWVGYSRIVESVSSLGKTVFYFTNFDEYPDYFDATTGYVSDYSWKRGNLFKTKVYSQTGTPLSVTTIDYNFDAPNKSTVNWKHQIPMLCNNSDIREYRNRYVSRPVLLKKQTTEIYDPSGNGKKMVGVVETNYSTDNDFPIETIRYDLNQPSKKYVQRNKFVTHNDYYDLVLNDCNDQYQSCINSCASEPDSQVRDYCYNSCSSSYGNCSALPPNGDPASVAIYKLRDRHQIAVPVESMELFQDGATTKVLSSSVNIFNVSGTQIHLKESYATNQIMDESAYTKTKVLGSGAFEKDPHLRKINSFDTYDTVSGNLLQQTSFGGIQTNYTWDASNNYVLSTTTTGEVNNRTASATYKPLVGQLTSTDANGRTTSTEYDVYNRAVITKDHDGNIVSRTRYHYKNETPGFRISASSVEALANEIFNFYAIDIAASVGGTPQLVWDLGDGTVIDNNSTSVIHSYSSPGQYTIKLAGLNPEYGPATRTLQIGVYNAMSATICLDGPNYLDLCNSATATYGACTELLDPNAPAILAVSVSDGCPSSYTYSWKYKKTTDASWIITNETNSTYTFYLPYSATSVIYEVQCTITDGCGHTTTISDFIQRDNNGCGTGFQN